jgi:hypothetical protein
MIDRRTFMLTSLASMLMPWVAPAGTRVDKPLSWTSYLGEMKQLAAAYADKAITQDVMAARGLQLLQQLDIADDEFRAAVHAAYESGNRFWLWQRLTRASDINGGILNIEQGKDVPLHDHPGATGMVRVLTGEVDVWQFDLIPMTAEPADTSVVLELVTHRVMQPGDIAVLSPDSGNIHALRARSKTCSMLDYFIPPYVRSERSWFLPVDKNRDNEQRITCQRIREDDFYMS